MYIYENRFEACRYNAVTTRLLIDMYLWLLKIVLSKNEGILNHKGLKESYFTSQKHDIIWKMSFTHKT